MSLKTNIVRQSTTMACGSFLIFFIYILAIPLAYATSSDSTQPAHFSADSVSFNQKTGTTIYTGHVQMQQGTTQLAADKVIVYKNQNGKTKQMVATGNPAHYKTLPEGQTKLVDAFGDTIIYDPPKKSATLLVNAHITQGQNSLSGEHIVYDIISRTITSFPPSGKDKPKSLLIIQPQEPPGK